MNAKTIIEKVCLMLLAILVPALTLPGLANAQDAGAVSREYLTLDWTEGRAFSPAVATEGGKTVWLAGVTATEDADGNSIMGDFEAQTHEIFRVIEERLATFGGTLADIGDNDGLHRWYALWRSVHRHTSDEVRTRTLSVERVDYRCGLRASGHAAGGQGDRGCRPQLGLTPLQYERDRSRLKTARPRIKFVLNGFDELK